jgi:WhiB family transcriptional regulator, redox-sensing transcriptional regulator
MSVEGVVEFLVNRQPWTDGALCTQVDGGDMFFPEKGELAKPAKQVCRRCEVRVECLKYALDNDERFGVWGGLSARERSKLGRTA